MLVQKCGYIKGGNAGGYMRYIATRDGVEFRSGPGAVTDKQRMLIEKVLRDFPDSAELFEYEDYLAAPTAANASSFLSMALDSNAHSITDTSGYMRYISLRPGAERHGVHGLFGKEQSADLDKTIEELQQHQGPVWTVIWSLRREDAARLNYENSDAWRGLLLAKQAEIAKAMQIPLENFRWYGAFHDAGHHPHIHVMVWSTDPSQGYLTQEGVKSMRSAMTNAIFKDEMLTLYQEKDVSYKALVRETRRTMARLTQEMTAGICKNNVLAEKMLALSEALETVKGKKQYGYLPKPLKAQVDEIVDSLTELPEVAACYDAWNELRDKLENYYKQSPRKHLPLSQQKEFRSIKNAVIKEADGLRSVTLRTDEEDIAEAVELAETVNMEPKLPQENNDAPIEIELHQEETDHPEFKMEPLPGPRRKRASADSHDTYEQAQRYRAAKSVLHDETSELQIRMAAIHALERLWEEGFTAAAHVLGKCYRSGVGVPMDKALAEYWFRRSANAGNDYSQYALGKLLLEQERPKEAMRWLRKAAAQGNQFAQYQMGKLCLAGDVMPKEVVEAIRFFYDAACQGNQYAQFTLGKLFLKGKDVAQDTEEARDWFTRAAEQGNAYAKFFLSNMDQTRDPSVFLSVTRLLYRLERLFQENATPPSTVAMSRIDSKRQRELMRKRLAAGHSIDDHEDPAMDQVGMKLQ